MESTDVGENYYSRDRQLILEFVPKETKCLLDVGCASGNFGQLVKDKINAVVFGVEINREAGEVAATKLDNVLIGAIEESIDELSAIKFDCITCNDVLEHLVDPFTTLIRLSKLLTDDGVIVASIPNIRYWPSFVDLVINRNWEYKNQGVLDRTHLRFFTKKSILNEFSRLGFSVKRIVGINPYWSRSFSLIKRLSFGMFDDCEYLQFVVVAKHRKVG